MEKFSYIVTTNCNRWGRASSLKDALKNARVSKGDEMFIMRLPNALVESISVSEMTGNAEWSYRGADIKVLKKKYGFNYHDIFMLGHFKALSATRIELSVGSAE